MRPLSLNARISLLLSGVVAVVLLGTGILISRAVENHFAEEDRQEIQGKLELIRHLLDRVRSTADLDAMSQELSDSLVGHPGLSVAVIDHDGAIWFATSNSAFPKYLVATRDTSPGTLRQWAENGTEYRGIATPMMVAGTTYTVAVALDIMHHLAFMAEFRRILAWAMALAAFATAALGSLAVWRGLQPLRAIALTAASISAERLSERLPESGVPGEIQALAASFNAMLGRLEDAFRRLSDFSSDIAHELRTPVSNLMTQTQVALANVRSAEEYREVLESSMEEYERLARMIGDMLFLAQADNGMVVPNRERIDLAIEIARLFEFYEAVAAEHGVRFTLDGQATAKGDRLMLQRAFSNLLSNALRYTPRGAAVSVSLGSDGTSSRAVVSNPGPPISKEHAARIFDRFYRADPSRREGAGSHTGLGLAITKSLIEANGGTIRAASDKGITAFEIVLPGGDAA
ncbi:MAG: heavy metal sensor histidine kinase [Betaproteobacteria bacterium]|nr:heavy metal sensor histidine kinase [Betaproteobacteria bacterium]